METSIFSLVDKEIDRENVKAAIKLTSIFRISSNIYIRASRIIIVWCNFLCQEM